MLTWIVSSDRRCGAIRNCLLCGAAAAVLLASASTADAQPVRGTTANPTRISRGTTDLDDIDRFLLQPGTQADFQRAPTRVLDPTPQFEAAQIDRRVLSNLLSELVSEVTQLYRRLDANSARYPEVRRSLADLLKLRARVSLLVEDSTAPGRINDVANGFQQVDADWRLLSHQFEQMATLDNVSRDSIGRIDRLDREVGKLFKIGPTLDRRKLLSQLAVLSSSLQNLIDEIQFEIGNTDQGIDAEISARKLQQQAIRVSDYVTDQRPYNQIVDEYMRLSREWSVLLPTINSIQSRYIERAARSISTADNDIHELLWLEHKSDREQLRQLTDALMRDVDEFFNRTPLKLLLYFQNSDQILSEADEFYGVCENFKDCVNRDQGDVELRDCYEYVEESGTRFISRFTGLRSQAGRVVLKEIEDGIAAIRNELHLADSIRFDARSLVTTVAALENLSDHLQYDVNAWLSSDRTAASYNVACRTAVTSFQNRLHALNGILLRNPTPEQVRAETESLYASWKTIYDYLSRCRTTDRAHLGQLAMEINDKLYDLKAPLDL